MHLVAFWAGAIPSDWAGITPGRDRRIRWDPQARTLRSAWAVTDRSCPNGIPAMSRASGVGLCVGRRAETWTVEAFDWDTGEEAWHVDLGTDNGVDSVYAALEIGPDGELVSGTLEGLVRVRRLP